MLIKKYLVQSQSDKSVVYSVMINRNGDHDCECMDFGMRKFRRGQYCKHINYILKKYYAPTKSGGTGNT